MQVKIRHFSNRFFLKFSIVAIAFSLIACSNSEPINSAEVETQSPAQDKQSTSQENLSNNSCSSTNSIIAASSSTTSTISNTKQNIKDYIPLDDTKYPYAGIPRIVIETNDNKDVKSKNTEISAKLQIYSNTAPISQIESITIRGRGNSSWSMPKKSYKIEFAEKRSLLGMPKNRDWALIANHADKTLMKNYLMYHMSTNLNAFYAPRCEFVELYLNKDYLGVYLLTETIKVGKNRVNIPENENSYLIEADNHYQKNEQVVFSSVLKKNFPYRIHYPHNISDSTKNHILRKIEDFEAFLLTVNPNKNDNNLEKWISLEDYARHFWVQEFSKNPDAGFYSSVYFTMTETDVIRMGPVWDFDLSFGGNMDERTLLTSNWQLVGCHWDKYLHYDAKYISILKDFWLKNRDLFESFPDTIEACRKQLEKAAKNNYKRWDITQNKNYQVFESFDAAVDKLKNYSRERFYWIDQNITNF